MNQIRLPDDIDANAAIDFTFYRQDQYLLVTYENKVFLYDADSGYLMDSLTYETSDEALNAGQYTLDLVTDSNGTYFALKDTSFSATTDRSSNRQMLILFTTDEEMNLYLYAQVSHGYASFSGDEVSVKTGGILYFTSLYDYDELREKAEALQAEWLLPA